MGDTYTIYCGDRKVSGPYTDLASAQMMMASLEWDDEAWTRHFDVETRREIRRVYHIVQS